MDAVFLKILNMSINASWLILFVCLLRPLLKRAPKTVNCLLWALVGVRLICPFSLESVLSLIPSAQTVPQNITQTNAPMIDSGIPIIDSSVNETIGESLAPTVENGANPMQVLVFAVSAAWLIGMIAMVLYGVISYVRLKLKVRASLTLKDNIRICDSISIPFILGLIKPRIYLPSGIDSDKAEYVIAHENAHLKRGDHLWKPLGFALLCVYWFNPIVWVAYILLCRDIELACDERVIKDMEDGAKITYSEALLSCAVSRRTIMVCPLAFGEVGVKSRVKSVLNYKKPAFWVILVSVLLCVAAAVFFLTDPKNESDSNLQVILSGSNITEKITVGELENKYGFDIYFYGIESVSIKIDGKRVDFKQALIDDIITPEKLLQLAYADSEKGYCEYGMYSDGGSSRYTYPTFGIYKQNSLLIDESKDITIYAITTQENTSPASGAALGSINDRVRVTPDQTAGSRMVTDSAFESKYGYNVYYSGISDARVYINGGWIDIEQGLSSGELTPDALLEKISEDAKKGRSITHLWMDGGSVTYAYEYFSITIERGFSPDGDIFISAYATQNHGSLRAIESGSAQAEKITVGELENKYGYDIYFQGIESVSLKIDGKWVDFKQALIYDTITPEKLLELAYEDAENGYCDKMYLEDGGSVFYIYDTFRIKKYKTLDGKKDMIIDNYGKSYSESNLQDNTSSTTPETSEPGPYGNMQILHVSCDEWDYSDVSYYYGRLENGVITIKHTYNKACDVDMTVTELFLAEDKMNNSVTLSPVKKDMEAKVNLISQHSDDLLFDIINSDTVSLKANNKHPRSHTQAVGGEIF